MRVIKTQVRQKDTQHVTDQNSAQLQQPRHDMKTSSDPYFIFSIAQAYMCW